MALDPYGLRPQMDAVNQSRGDTAKKDLVGVKFRKCVNGPPVFRSSWEVKFAMNLEADANVAAWFSEPKMFNLMYTNPVTNQKSTYWPDFLVKYIDGRIEIVEIKPSKQSVVRFALSIADKIELAKNMAKWQVAAAFAKSQNWGFRVLTEQSLFGTKKTARKPRQAKTTVKPRGTQGTRGTRK